jgi:hypothetical protein
MAKVARFERNLRQGEPHAGVRPDRSLGRPASEAAKRSQRIEGRRPTEIRKASQSHAFDSPMSREGRKPESSTDEEQHCDGLIFAAIFQRSDHRKSGSELILKERGE